jgi:hypothetical protein
MKIKTTTFVEKKMLGSVSDHTAVPAWVASFEDCGVCGDRIALKGKVIVARLDFDDGHGENRFFHKACFDDAKEG